MEANDDAAILDQQHRIEEDIAKSQPLVDEISSLIDFQKDYVDNPRFFSGLDHLLHNQAYTSIRRIRGDGNCFYRGFLYRLLESLTSDERLSAFLHTIEASKPPLLQQGYDEMTIDPFYDEFIEFLTQFQLSELHAYFNSMDSNYLVWYMRLLTAGYLKAHSDRFLPFVNEPSIQEFCQKHVEPMGKECEQVQIIALTEALQTGVNIEYLDGNDQRIHLGPETSGVSNITLLYRPGHYDILY